MDASGIHELTAAYALDALDGDDERRYEEHLATCEHCRDELASLRNASAALAYAVDAPPPPPSLRGRILEQARGERGDLVPLRRPWFGPVLATTTAVAAAAAIVLAVWASSLHGSLDRERSARQREAAVIEILADPSASRSPLTGAKGSLVIGAERRAALAVANLARAPKGRTYEAWVAAGGRPEPAGVFAGGSRYAVIRLTRPVPKDATVLVTIERAGGVSRPTTKPLLVASAA